ncbi:hypothetical protein LguiA_031515 [Lonicera macranthoides]
MMNDTTSQSNGKNYPTYAQHRSNRTPIGPLAKKDVTFTVTGARVVDLSVYPTGPPVLVQSQKLLKLVDMSQLRRGPLDNLSY